MYPFPSSSPSLSHVGHGDVDGSKESSKALYSAIFAKLCTPLRYQWTTKDEGGHSHMTPETIFIYILYKG